MWLIGAGRGEGRNVLWRTGRERHTELLRHVAQVLAGVLCAQFYFLSEAITFLELT